jgi:peptidoglycan lytic transglycosylase A
MKKKLSILSALIVLIVVVIYLQTPKAIRLEKTSFNVLPGWQQANLMQSLATFQKSCRVFLRQNREKYVGSRVIAMTASDWVGPCKAAMALKNDSNPKVRDFFETWFSPITITNDKPVSGLFTGYYQPLLHGSFEKTDKFNIPLYGVPQNLVTIDLSLFDPNLKHKKITGRVEGHKVYPFYTREQINKGAIKKSSPVLVWVDDRVERFFLEIQGSGIVELEDGKRLYIGYAGKNGAPYKAIGNVLLKMGLFDKDSMSMQNIRKYLLAHPDTMDAVLHQNQSFVFFTILNQDAAFGSQGVALTPGYSMAVDLKYIPHGTPIWLKTTVPGKKSDTQHSLSRLMIAQDTGGAIKGIVRGDFFWGAGVDATYNAGHMKNKGYYWMMLPKKVASRIDGMKIH